MKSELISVIVPVYNGAAYIERCIRSVLMQEYGEWELLLVDGASTDSTLKICRTWQKRDDRIRVIPTEVNRGVSAGRNTGMEKAKGDFIFFLDADDWLMPDCLGRLYGEIQEPDVDIAGCAFKRCTVKDWDILYECIQRNGTEILRAEKTDQPKRLIAGRDFLEEGILRQDTRCWGKLYRKQVAEGHFFREDYTIGEDMLFLWEVSAGARKICSSDYEGYCYYHNPSGAMLKPFRESDMDQIRCWQEILRSLQKRKEFCGRTQRQNEQPADRMRRQDEQSAGGIQRQDEAVGSDAISRCASILLISCMLVAGKLAGLSGEQRKQYRELREQCSRTLEETLQIPGAYEGLDRGYRLKVSLYRRAPELYLLLYHIHKKV